MSHTAFTVGPVGAVILAAEDAWADYAKENNIENVFWKRFAEKVPRQDINAYRRMKDRWIVDWALENEGYAVAARIAAMWNDDNNDLIWWLEQKVLCEEANGECNIFCKNFETCIKEGFKQWN